MELNSKLILAVMAIVILAACILVDELRTRMPKAQKRHKLTISLSLLYTYAVFTRTYRYQWLAVLAAWWHGRNLKNFKPFDVSTQIEEIYE